MVTTTRSQKLRGVKKQRKTRGKTSIQECIANKSERGSGLPTKEKQKEPGSTNMLFFGGGLKWKQNRFCVDEDGIYSSSLSSQSQASREPANQPRPQLSHQTRCLSPAPTPMVGLLRLLEPFGEVSEADGPPAMTLVS